MRIFWRNKKKTQRWVLIFDRIAFYCFITLIDRFDHFLLSRLTTMSSAQSGIKWTEVQYLNYQLNYANQFQINNIHYLAQRNHKVTKFFIVIENQYFFLWNNWIKIIFFRGNPIERYRCTQPMGTAQVATTWNTI